MSIQFFIEGTPCGQPRPCFYGHHAYNPPGPIDAWKAAIAYGSRIHRPKLPLTGPLEVNLSFVFDRPKSHYKGTFLRENAPTHHIVKSDIDNLGKAVFDTLTREAFWVDDSQIARTYLCKRYVSRDEKSGVLIFISPL